jgi:GDPmannose 4,6-dehydratase
VRLLEATRLSGRDARYYQASSSEMFGSSPPPQSESTPHHPRSPYAVAKVYAYWATVNAREAYGMHATNGILFNHESPRRGPTFVTRKITRAVARIHKGAQKCLFLGNLDAKRDWGHARDYVEGMWRMLQVDEADDYVLATNETHPVREFVEKAFGHVGITIKWMGATGTVDEYGVDAADESKVLVRVDPKYFRPTEVDLLIGDASKAKEKLGWVPTTLFSSLVEEMVAADIADFVRGEGPERE